MLSMPKIAEENSTKWRTTDMKRGLVGMNNKEIIEKWMCAFDDEEFQDKLQNYRNQIEKIIKD